MANITATNNTKLYAPQYPSSATSYYILEAKFEETATSALNNTSTIKVTANISNKNIRFTGSNNTLNIYWFDDNENTQGTLVSTLNVNAIYPASAATVKTVTTEGTITVNHKSDGKLSGYARAVWDKIQTNAYAPNDGNVSTANTNLTTIPRYATITSFSVAKRDEKSLRVNYTTDAAVDLAQYSLNGTNYYTLKTDSNGSYIDGLNPDTSYSVYLRVRRKDSQQYTTSTSAQTQRTYAYPSVTNTPELTIGNALNITISNPLKRAVTAKITIGTTEYSISGTFSGETIGTFNDATWQQRFYAALGTTGKNGQYTIKITYSGNDSSKTGNFKINEASCKPVISSTAKAEVIGTIYNLTNNSKQLITGLSQVKITGALTRASAANDTTATFKNYKYGNTTFTSTLTLNNQNAIEYTIYAINSRGISSDAYKLTLVRHPYIAPTIAAEFSRPIQVGNQMSLSASGNWYNGFFDTTNSRNPNSITATWYVRLSEQDPWTKGGDITPTTSSGSNYWYITSRNISNPLSQDHTWDYQTQYFFYIEVKDVLISQQYFQYVTIGQPYYEWWRDNNTNYFNVRGKIQRDGIDLDNIYVPLSEFAYKSGDVYQNINNGVYLGGTLTGGQKSIVFSLPVPKSMKNISTITFNQLNMDIRKVSGGYLITGTDVVASADYSVAAVKNNDNMIRVTITCVNAQSEVNNTPLGICLNATKITFS